MTKRFDPELPPDFGDIELPLDKLKTILAAPRFAKLENEKIIPCTLEEWAAWDPDRELRIIGRDDSPTHLVSTIFLGLNHAFHGAVRPHWFETMIFDTSTAGTEYDLGTGKTWVSKIGDVIYEERYTTLEEAREGHQAALAWLKDQLSSR